MFFFFLLLILVLFNLLKLIPVLSDLEYLQDQHLLLSVKSCDGFESYGQCKAFSVKNG